MSDRSPYITTKQVAELICVDQTKHPLINAWKFLKKNRIPTYGNGRLKVLRASVIEALEDEAKERKARRRTAC